MTWQRMTLGALGAQAQTGFASGKHAGDGEVLHLRPMNITPLGTLTLEGSKFVESQAGAQRVQRGDILFNNTNSPKWVGKTAWISAADELAFSNHMTRIRVPDDRIVSKFLASYLHFKQVTGYFEAICSNHVNQASVSRRRLLETEVPVPPADEQRRIVAILEDHLSRLDAAEASLARATHRLELQELAGLAQLFKDANRWPRKTAHQLVGEDRSKLVIGPFGSNLKTSDYRGEGVPLVFVRDIRSRSFDSPRAFVDEDKAIELSSHVVIPGDVLITKMGEPPGDTAVYRGDGPAVITADCIRLRPMTGIDSRYVALALGTADARAQIGKITSGVAQQKVSLGRFRDGVSIPVPSRLIQSRIVEQGQELLDSTARLRIGIQQALTRSSALRRSLLAGAFSGRLTGSSAEMSEVAGMIDA